MIRMTVIFDLLVSFEKRRSLFDLIRFKQEIKLMGRNVDVVTENSIHQSIKSEILNEVRPI
ncbi:nucleotidyltransferase family protein [Lederbergia sp. NSJ-179]|uniref:nucleotidyltransferase family protein n=1 Tax=Lederbergia sp. NSJ-179 TaxID=2931402 RepID=UPI0037C04C45